MGGCEIDEESHRNCVCVCASQRYRATDLATGTSEGTCQFCVWQGDMTRALDLSVCVCVWEGVVGGVGRGLTIEVERLVYVFRRRDPAMS